MNTLISYWKGHGTKILGVLVTITSLLQAAASQIIAVLPPTWAPWFNLSLAVLGFMVVKRGFTNSRAQ